MFSIVIYFLLFSFFFFLVCLYVSVDSIFNRAVFISFSFKIFKYDDDDDDVIFAQSCTEKSLFPYVQRI